MSEADVGCARPTGTVVGQTPSPPGEGDSNHDKDSMEEVMVQVRVGGKAPDFEAPAYLKGKFTSVKLSDYLGKWVLVCFYPGDFTFV